MGGVYLRPCLDDGENLGWAEVREREIVGGRECYHVAFARDGICTEKDIREIYIHIAVRETQELMKWWADL